MVTKQLTEYLEFTIESTERFEKMKTLFAALKKAREEESEDTSEKTWKHYLDKKAEKFFAWTDQDGVVGKWYYESMLMMLITDYEVELVRCELIDENTGRLDYTALSYPHGGSGAFKALIEAFGGKITKEET